MLRLSTYNPPSLSALHNLELVVDMYVEFVLSIRCVWVYGYSVALYLVTVTYFSECFAIAEAGDIGIRTRW